MWGATVCGGLDFWGASVCGGLLAILDFGGLVCLSLILHTALKDSTAILSILFIFFAKPYPA